MYTPGDIVFAKVKGYSPWPAQIMCHVSQNKFKVFFYGTREVMSLQRLALYLLHFLISQESLVDVDYIWNSADNLDYFSRKYGERPDYYRALEEMEKKPNIFAVHDEDLCHHKCITCDQKRKLDDSQVNRTKNVKVVLKKHSESELIYKTQGNDERPQQNHIRMEETELLKIWLNLI